MSASESTVRRRGRSGAVLAGLSLLVLTRTVRAQDDSSMSPTSVASECATRAEWLALVQARLPPLLRTHPLLETLSVRIWRGVADEQQFTGELLSSSEAPLSWARRVRGETCEELLDALSFIAVLGLESVAAGEGESSASVTEAQPALTDTIGVDESPAAGAEGRERMRWGAVGFALLQDGLTPGRALDFGIALRFAWSTPSWQPLLLVGAYSNVADNVQMPGGGQVHFEHWSSHVVACPWRFPRASALAVRPCLELDVGRSSGEGLAVEGATKRWAPWISGGAQLRAELTTWEPVELGVSVAGVVPFWRAHFLFTPDVMSFEAPAFGFRAGSYASVIF